MAENYAEGNSGGYSEGCSESFEQSLWRELRGEEDEALRERTGCKELEAATGGVKETNPEINGGAEETGRPAGRAGGELLITCFGQPITIDRENGRFLSDSGTGRYLLNEKREKVVPALLHYLARVEPISVAGELLKPSNIPGGIIFVQGTHVLPLDRLARKYNDDPSGFLSRAETLGGVDVGYGDVACRIFVFPKIPITIVLRFGDEEFPPKGELYFDTSARTALPPDVLWAVADLTVELLLSGVME